MFAEKVHPSYYGHITVGAAQSSVYGRDNAKIVIRIADGGSNADTTYRFLWIPQKYDWTGVVITAC